MMATPPQATCTHVAAGLSLSVMQSCTRAAHTHISPHLHIRVWVHHEAHDQLLAAQLSHNAAPCGRVAGGEPGWVRGAC